MQTSHRDRGLSWLSDSCFTEIFLFWLPSTCPLSSMARLSWPKSNTKTEIEQKQKRKIQNIDKFHKNKATKHQLTTCLRQYVPLPMCTWYTCLAPYLNPNRLRSKDWTLSSKKSQRWSIDQISGQEAAGCREVVGCGVDIIMELWKLS